MHFCMRVDAAWCAASRSLRRERKHRLQAVISLALLLIQTCSRTADTRTNNRAMDSRINNHTCRHAGTWARGHAGRHAGTQARRHAASRAYSLARTLARTHARTHATPHARTHARAGHTLCLQQVPHMIPPQRPHRRRGPGFGLRSADARTRSAWNTMCVRRGGGLAVPPRQPVYSAPAGPSKGPPTASRNCWEQCMQRSVASSGR